MYNWRTERDAMQVGFEAECPTPDCPETFFLPEPTPPQSFEVQPYSPTGTWPLLLVCPRCKHGHTLERGHFYPSTREAPAEQNDDAVLWFLVIQCSERNCPLLLRLHTIAAADLLPISVETLISTAIGEFRCEAGHQIEVSDPPRVAVIQRATRAF